MWFVGLALGFLVGRFFFALLVLLQAFFYLFFPSFWFLFVYPCGLLGA